MAAENKRSSSVAGDEAVAEEQQIDAVVSCAIDDFCDALVAERNASGNTVRAYRTDLGDYGRWAYREKLDALHASHRDLRRYLAQLDAARYSRRTVNRRLSRSSGRRAESTFRRFFARAIWHGCCRSTPRAI